MPRWPTPLERFTGKVRKTETCWLWLGSVRPDGYGNTNAGPAQWLAWELFCGPRTKGLEVCHSCNNKLCVNLEHLYEATHQKNMQDAARDGLMGRPGKKHLYEEIRRLYEEGKTQTSIAAQFGMAQASVSVIVRRIGYASRV
jgi:hypothetical protein